MCSWLGMLCVLAKMAKAGLKWKAKGQIGQAHAKMDAGGQFPYMSQKGQRVGARDEGGNPLIKDCYSNPLTASGNPHDDMLLSKLESIYTESDVKTAVKNKVPLVRSLTLNWVTFCIETSNKAVVLKLHKDYVPICMELVGMRPLERSLEKLDEVRKYKLSEMIGGFRRWFQCRMKTCCRCVATVAAAATA